MASGKLSYTNPDLYEVYFMDEVPALSNALRALAAYKQFHGEYWPSSVLIHSECRRAIFFGGDIALKHVIWTHRSAYYMSLHMPLYDPHDSSYQPTVFKGVRISAAENPANLRRTFRFRKDFNNSYSKDD